MFVPLGKIAKASLSLAMSLHFVGIVSSGHWNIVREPAARSIIWPIIQRQLHFCAEPFLAAVGAAGIYDLMILPSEVIFRVEYAPRISICTWSLYSPLNLSA